MAGIRVTKEDIESLEFKADLAYGMLKLAVETQQPSILSSAECLYKDDLGAYLSALTRRSTSRGVRHLNKGGKRVKKIEGYILQHVLMHNPSVNKSDKYKMEIAENPDDGMGGLKAYIDAEDCRDSAEGEVFRLIQHKAIELRKNKRYDLILKAIEYVRENYSLSDKSIQVQITANPSS